MKRYLMMVAAVILAAVCVRGQVRVSILTAAPGSDVYQLEGHTGLRVTDSVRGFDVVVNYGVFDFASPNFIYRFVKGETDYMAAEMDAQWFIASYLRSGRDVTEQVLRLTPQECERLEELLAENLKPENATYRYNYVKDNCATRPLAMVERAIDRSITLTEAPEAEPTTFRREMTRYHRQFPWYQFGIDLALGSGIDYELTERERCFAPVELARALSGNPIVSENITYRADFELENEPTPWPLRPLTVCWAVFALTVGVSLYDVKRRRQSRWLDTLLMGAFGVAGCVVAFLVLISTHEATSPNWLLAWVNPFCLLGAVLPWIKPWKNAVFCYEIINFAVLIILITLWKFTGQQMNDAFVPLIAADVMRSGVIIYICRKGQ
jgi:hypothetical protein